jgi:Domain of unknown function (DUF4214)
MKRQTPAGRCLLLALIGATLLLPSVASAARYDDPNSLIEDAYRKILRRPGDSGGISFWSGILATYYQDCNNGGGDVEGCRLQARASILSEFLLCTEFSQRVYCAATTTNQQYVQGLYRNLLNRWGDQGGLDYWTGELDNGHQTRASLVTAFVGCAEWMAKWGTDPAPADPFAPAHPVPTAVTTTAQLIFKVGINGQWSALSIDFDPYWHRFQRFRYDPSSNSIVFETSPDKTNWTVKHSTLLQRSVSELIVELSAGTVMPNSNPASSTAVDPFQFGTCPAGMVRDCTGQCI